MNETFKKELKNYFDNNESEKNHLGEACGIINMISADLDIDDPDIVFDYVWNNIFITKHIYKEGQKVEILSGFDKGKSGIIQKVYPDTGAGTPVVVLVDDCVHSYNGESELKIIENV